LVLNCNNNNVLWVSVVSTQMLYHMNVQYINVRSIKRDTTHCCV